MPSSDIQRFWAETRTALATVPPDVQLTPVEGLSDGTLTAYRIAMTSFGGIRVRGFYFVPNGTPPAGGWPALLVTPGYSEGFTSPLHYVRYGYALLFLFPRSQNESRDDWQIEHSTKLTYYVTDRDRYYYRGAYMDCVRAIDVLTTLPNVNPNRIGMYGLSQGGGFALATTSLDPRIKATVAWEPFLCNFPVAVTLATDPFVELRDYLIANPEQRTQVLDTLSYFDPLNLADAIQVPVLVSIGGRDDVCPEETILPVFNAVRSRKTLVYLPELSHGSSVDYAVETKGWMDRFL